ncbi:MAG TPA: caspase family protein [Allosphingosinicella sp.]|jgi:hypothetical protein
MRKALIVGISYYTHLPLLSGCVNDAHAMKAMLERHADGSVNFHVKLIVANSENDSINRGGLREAIRELFAGDGEVALLYFAGHGHIEATGGYICASDCESGDDGVSLGDIMIFANQSDARNKVMLLDSCHSGITGAHPLVGAASEIADGVAILTASTAEQGAFEEDGSGVFTGLVVDALGGAAANLVGDVTPGSIYAHVDQSLGWWGQRPVFKTNVKGFVSLRKTAPPIDLNDLRRITEFFPAAGHLFPLDPSYEPERSPVAPEGVPEPDPEKTTVFSILQKYNRLNLLIPEDAPHMWHAAMESKAVRLTALGEHYRRLVDKELI